MILAYIFLINNFQNGKVSKEIAQMKRSGMYSGLIFYNCGKEVKRVKRERLNNLEMEMKIKGISRKDIAEFLGLTYRTIHSRFNGESEWTFSECVKVRNKYFPGMNLEQLFSVSER